MTDIVPRLRAFAAYLAYPGHFLIPPVSVYALQRRGRLLSDYLNRVILNLFAATELINTLIYI